MISFPIIATILVMSRTTMMMHHAVVCVETNFCYLCPLEAAFQIGQHVLHALRLFRLCLDKCGPPFPSHTSKPGSQVATKEPIIVFLGANDRYLANFVSGHIFRVLGGALGIVRL